MTRGPSMRIRPGPASTITSAIHWKANDGAILMATQGNDGLSEGRLRTGWSVAHLQVVERWALLGLVPPIRFYDQPGKLAFPSELPPSPSLFTAPTLSPP
ncbi:hypothetical protein FRB99_004837, partial [Tulasnella sp. 403]